MGQRWDHRSPYHLSTLGDLNHSLTIKVVVYACYGAYFVGHIFKYLAPNFVSGGSDLHDAAFQNFCIPECAIFNCSHDLQLSARLSKYQCTLRRGGGEVNQQTDRGVPFWLLKWYPKIEFSHKNPAQKFILQEYACCFSKENCVTTNLSRKNAWPVAYCRLQKSVNYEILGQILSF